MDRVIRLKRHIRAMAQAVALLVLVCSMLAPKVSLAFVTLFGSTASSVLICTGNGLKRVSLSPSGEIVDGASSEDSWVSPQCALPDQRASELERAWQQFSYPQFAAVALLSVGQGIRPPSALLWPSVLSRGPPAAW